MKPWRDPEDSTKHKLTMGCGGIAAVLFAFLGFAAVLRKQISFQHRFREVVVEETDAIVAGLLMISASLLISVFVYRAWRDH